MNKLNDKYQVVQITLNIIEFLKNKKMQFIKRLIYLFF